MTFEIFIVLFGLVSPTFWLAKLLKAKFNKEKTIRLLNWIYFLISLIFILLLCVDNAVSKSSVNSISPTFNWFWSVFLLSRCTEILYAFLIDAYDKVSKGILKPINGNAKMWYSLEFGSEPIEIHHRLVLAFRSYIELVSNFSVLYLLLPASYWKGITQPLDVINTLYFSGVTITTLGYGDISPIHWFPQFLSVYEVFCGFTLLVVCFAIYLSNKSN